eukprot:scaffold4902_cov115-Cylindrotheca_fusiformis.AAC.3
MQHQQGENALLVIKKTPNDAAKEILRNSFCIYQADSFTTDLILQARCQALGILDEPSTSLTSCKRIVHGDLHGYHVPSPAKRLFRAFPLSDLQPWPNKSFQIASKQLAASLHKTLETIMDHIHQQGSSESHHINGHNQRMRKRARTSASRFQNHQIQTPPRIDESFQQSFLRNDSAIVDVSRCPLDYFFYHNEEPSVVNCSEHVDRGLLICVCLSSATPGLEVRRRGDRRQFVCPEAELIHNVNLYQEKDAVSGLLCIMAGDALCEFFPPDDTPIACVHRVRNKLKRARLSISYELRTF